MRRNLRTGLLLLALLGGCSMVPFQEDLLQGALFVDSLQETARFVIAAPEKHDEIRWTQDATFFPTGDPRERSGYLLIQENEYRTHIYLVENGRLAERIETDTMGAPFHDAWVHGDQLLVIYRNFTLFRVQMLPDRHVSTEVSFDTVQIRGITVRYPDGEEPDISVLTRDDSNQWREYRVPWSGLFDTDPTQLPPFRIPEGPVPTAARFIRTADAGYLSWGGASPQVVRWQATNPSITEATVVTTPRTPLILRRATEAGSLLTGQRGKISEYELAPDTNNELVLNQIQDQGTVVRVAPRLYTNVTLSQRAFGEGTLVISVFETP